MQISDWFFIITGGAILFIAVLVGAVLIYVVLFLRTVIMVTRQAKRAAEVVTDDLRDLGTSIKQKGFSLSSILYFFLNLWRTGKNVKDKPKKK